MALSLPIIFRLAIKQRSHPRAWMLAPARRCFFRIPPGSASQPHLMIGASKNGSLYVANRDNLGGYNAICPDASSRVQTVPVGDGPILSTPVFWNNAIYAAAGNGTLKEFPMPGGILASSPSASQSPETLGPQGATPVVSSKGASNALIWLIDTSGALATPNTPAILRAFDPNNLSNEIYNSGQCCHCVIPRVSP